MGARPRPKPLDVALQLMGLKAPTREVAEATGRTVGELAAAFSASDVTRATSQFLALLALGVPEGVLRGLDVAAEILPEPVEFLAQQPPKQTADFLRRVRLEFDKTTRELQRAARRRRAQRMQKGRP